MTVNSAKIFKVTLQEARAKGAPGGAGQTGYEFFAPLDTAGHIDLEAWKDERARCFVHRLDHNAVVERGLLVHRAGGVGGATWAFDYKAGASLIIRPVLVTTRRRDIVSEPTRSLRASMSPSEMGTETL